jgi:uncharacterized protein (DUF2252 family)
MTTATPPTATAPKPRTASRRASKPAPLTPEDRAAQGRAIRSTVPLESHSELKLDKSRPDPVALLEEQDASRVPELVPVRHGRMVVSPFTFYRGAAAVMAGDLVNTPRSGLITQLCGDAHLSNFGLFGSPERRLVFDINDFDETLPGPFEWDVKRLAASLAVAGISNGYNDKQRRAAVVAAVGSYRRAMSEFALMRDLDVWYSHADMTDVRRMLADQLDPKRLKQVDKMMNKAHTKDSMDALSKLTTIVDGSPRIVANPPLLVPLSDLLSPGEDRDFEARIQALIGQYTQTLQSDRKHLVEKYRFVDMARKVVGVGSVGTRCWIVLLVGRDNNDPLFLQIKEAGESVLSRHLGKSEYNNQGQRVVAGQQLMQQASDIFLGWQHTTGIDGSERDFYVRQLRDWKGSVLVDALQPKGMRLYAELCGWCLARAHARSGDRIAISGYLGEEDTFDQAVADFSDKYAELNARDHAALAEAIASGRVDSQSGL